MCLPDSHWVMKLHLPKKAPHPVVEMMRAFGNRSGRLAACTVVRTLGRTRRGLAGQGICRLASQGGARRKSGDENKGEGSRGLPGCARRSFVLVGATRLLDLGELGMKGRLVRGWQCFAALWANSDSKTVIAGLGAKRRAGLLEVKGSSRVGATFSWSLFVILGTHPLRYCTFIRLDVSYFSVRFEFPVS